MAAVFCPLTGCPHFSATTKLNVPNFCILYESVTECPKFAALLAVPSKDCTAGKFGGCSAYIDGGCTEYGGIDIYRCDNHYAFIETMVTSTPQPPKPAAPAVEPAVTETAHGLQFREFKSPQTGSVYTVINSSKKVFVSYRATGDNMVRVRIQGTPAVLQALQKRLTIPAAWGTVKDGDHLSIELNAGLDFANAVGDVVRAMVLAGLY
jgi:hypothetical protein